MNRFGGIRDEFFSCRILTGRPGHMMSKRFFFREYVDNANEPPRWHGDGLDNQMLEVFG
jgi:hypothetical protein